MRTKIPLFCPGVNTSPVLFAPQRSGCFGEIFMSFKASMRSGLIVAASLWLCAAGTARAAEGDAAAPDATANVGSASDTDSAPAAKPRKHHAARKVAPKVHKAAAKPAPKSTDEAADDAKPGSNGGGAISPSVANANAQWPAQAAPDTTSNMAAQADSVLRQASPQPEQPAMAVPASTASNDQVIAPDQLNDLDRAATEQPAPPLTLAKATVDVAAAPAATETVSTDNSTWDRTSMIGKVFIAFGGVLTMASALRMFMA
jgi:hypothetical protein